MTNPSLRSRVATSPRRGAWGVAASVAYALAACSTEAPQPAPPAPGGGSAGAASDSAPPAVPDVSAVPLDCAERPVIAGEFSKRSLLTAAADCASWHYCQFEAAAAALDDAVGTYVASANDESLATARSAWREAMLAWGGAELFQFGPAGSRADDPYYGASFRDRIYAWPSASRCRVEEQVVSQAYQSGFDAVLVGAKGLYALEYLLFYEGSDTACAPTSAARAGWDALAAEELEQRKRAYAGAVSRDVLSLARELRSIWHPSGGNFRQTFIDAVGYDTPGSDADQEALNIVAWSLVYGEKEVKDWKVGPFTGKMLPLAPVDGFEAPHAGLAQPLTVANLEGLRGLYQGCGDAGEGLGFDDWLVAANHGDLALAIDAAMATAIDAVRAFPPFSEASEEQFATLYDTGVKPLTDLLKNDLLAGNGSALNLSLPASAAADND